MIKRTSKITSLLVAAATVVSIVPASAADYKKVDSQDGIIYNAVAFKDGSAIIDGEIEDNDGAYFLTGGKYSALEDVDSGSDFATYGTKFANVDEGDYFVDLATGTVTDDSIDEDDQDDTASALRKNIKDSDRYLGTVTAETVFGDTDIATLTTVAGNKFGATWYETKIAADAASKAGLTDGTNPYFTVYTDAKGNYVDADYNLGKIKVSTTSSATATTASAVTIENTDDTYELRGSDDTFATISESITLGQDTDNIYRYAVITVTTIADKDGNVVINNKPFAATAIADGKSTVALKVIQKISKAQASDDIDDANYAKTVTNYVISDDSNTVNANSNESEFLSLASDTTGTTQARVIGGKLVLFQVTEDDTEDNVLVQAATLKSKNGFYYTDIEDETTITAEFNEDLEKTAFDTDVDGNIYVIESGYIQKFDGTDDWNKVYKVDGSMNSLSIYDKDNMVVWSQDDEVYSVIGGKTTTDTTTTPDTTTPPATTPVVTAGWNKAADQTWSFVKADGTKATGWLNDNGTWYFLKADGNMATGWVNDNGTWYYLSNSGAMKTGWVNDNGTWYFLYASGAMAANTVVDGYKLAASGAWLA